MSMNDQARSTRQRSTRPSRTNNAGLSNPVQKQLLQDIEASGGLQALKSKRRGIAKLCDTKAEIYGLPKSRTRKQVQNKIYKWYSLSEADYYRVLAEFQVQPFSATFASVEIESSEGGEEKEEEEADESETESEEEESSVETATPPRPETPPRLATPPRPATPPVGRRLSRTPTSSANRQQATTMAAARDMNVLENGKCTCLSSGPE